MLASKGMKSISSLQPLTYEISIVHWPLEPLARASYTYSF